MIPYVIINVLYNNYNIKTLYRLCDNNPILNYYRTFYASNSELLPNINLLKFELYDKDFTDHDDFVGSTVIKISQSFINIDNHHISTKKSNAFRLHHQLQITTMM